MVTLRSILPLVLALCATTALTGRVHGQMRGQVGQSTDRIYDPAMDASRARPSNTSGTEGDSRDGQRPRSPSAAQSLGGGSGVINPNVRAAVRKRTRTAFTLTRPPNRVVRAPMTAPRNPAIAGPLIPPPRENTDIVAPGLSESPMARRRRPKADDPYAPVGLRLGGLTVMPGVDLMAGVDSNPLRNGAGTKIKGSMLYQVSPDLMIASDWSRHSLQVDLRGSYSYYPGVDNASRPAFEGKVVFKGDISQDTVLNLELKERVDTQRPGSTELTNAVKGRPAYYTHSGSLGVTHTIGRTAITAAALVDRTTYDNGTTYAGTTYDQQDRNYTTYGGRLRGAYEITPGIMPFVEVSADTRQHDQEVDATGYRRSSVGAIARAGSTFELTRTLTGEVSAGWGLRDYEDRRLDNLSGGLIDASLVWQLSPLTKVTAKAGSEFQETTSMGSSGAVSRKISLEVAHDLWRNLTMTGSLAYAVSTYQGTGRVEQTITPGMKLDYKIDRNFIIRGSYNYERAISEVAGSGYFSHTFLMGLRIQR